MRVFTSIILTAIFAVGSFSSELDPRYVTDSKSKNAFSTPFSGMSDVEEDIFILGKSFFRIPWVEAPSATTARDGLGPLFNGNTCMSCHPRNGIGKLYSQEGVVNRALVGRLSIPNNTSFVEKMGFTPEPTYGSQLSINSVHGVRHEGRIVIENQKILVTYPDGESKELLKPTYTIKDLGYGKMHPQTAISMRLAPPLIGLGFLDDIDDKDLLANEDSEDLNGDGISGKANIVYSVESRSFEVGRYTYKSSAPTVKQQVAGAMVNDMGLTTDLFPRDNCTQEQKECLEAPKAAHPIDVPSDRLDAVTFYIKNQKLPKRVITSQKGEKLFTTIGCVKCHVESFDTPKGKIYPYSDLLLHDMGEGLSDGREEFKAGVNEWRTIPLWGTSLKSIVLGEEARFLHDGRARDVEEAILWHGGESENIKKRFMSLEKSLRSEIIKFVEGL